MEKEQVKQIMLLDGNRYTGWGYNNPQGFVPHGCGKKYFKNYYAYGNFQNGILEGPAIVSHDFYMNTAQFKKQSWQWLGTMYKQRGTCRIWLL